MLLVVQALITVVEFFKRVPKRYESLACSVPYCKQTQTNDKIVRVHHTLESVTSGEATGCHSRCLSEVLFTSAFLSPQIM